MNDGQAHQSESNEAGAFDPARQQAMRWATTLLKSENAKPTHMRLQALRFIESKEFAPSDEAWDLARFLSTDGAIDDSYNQLPTFRAAREQMAEVALGQFARTFFELNPEERAVRFRELREQWGDCPRAEFFLRQLSPGLQIDVTVKKESPLVSELAECAAQLFVLRPVDRAQRRYEILSSMGPRVREAEKAAQRIMKHYPEIANLAPDVIPALAKHTKTMAAAKKPKVIRRKRVTTKRKFGPWSGSWILIVVVLGLLRGLTENSQQNSGPAYTPQRFVPYSPPPHIVRGPAYEQRFHENPEPAMRDYYSRQDQSQDVSSHAQPSPSQQWPPNHEWPKARRDASLRSVRLPEDYDGGTASKEERKTAPYDETRRAI